MRKRSVQEIIEVVDLKDPNRTKTAGGADITAVFFGNIFS